MRDKESRLRAGEAQRLKLWNHSEFRVVTASKNDSSGVLGVWGSLMGKGEVQYLRFQVATMGVDNRASGLWH